MAYKGLNDFISDIEKISELHRIKTFMNPDLEITEVADRVTKSGGKALLFENTGTPFPLLINAFGSAARMAMALGRKNLDEAASDISELFRMMTSGGGSILRKLSVIPDLVRVSGYLPVRKSKRGECQRNIINTPDLGILPVQKCWPFDGGRFFTLPMVHTIHPDTGRPNLGMYRMQILARDKTAMHWQRHKTGAAHFEAWKKTGRRMPVSVTLGGDPVYTYCATAPLPENIDEYILAGFLRKNKVSLVKCLTNELYVPSDADIVIEGYVDPGEDMVTEGPFGDHTGFYSLSDQYPVFHVTCITHRDNAVYPATIVGVPPQEDAWLARATEKLFLEPVRIALQPEIIDLHMPDAGVAHNLVIVKINKSYPGQGMKVISSLSGAGQMMFTKYLVVVSGDVNIRNYEELTTFVLNNTSFATDCVFTRGPLDVLDHTSDIFSFGGKAGIDATEKLPEELLSRKHDPDKKRKGEQLRIAELLNVPFVRSFNDDLAGKGIGILPVGLNPSEDPDSKDKLCNLIRTRTVNENVRLVIAVDHTVDIHDLFTLAWQVLGNSDPVRDHSFVTDDILLIDGTIKYYGRKKFPRRWPNIVCSDNDTIRQVDEKWNGMGFKEFLTSPSLKYGLLVRKGADEIED